MANFILKSSGHGSIQHPIEKIHLRAEKVTEQPERWYLEFKIRGMPMDVTHLLELTTAEVDELFLAYEMLKPIIQNADNLPKPDAFK